MKEKTVTFFIVLFSILITTLHITNIAMGDTTNTTNVTITLGRLATVLSLTDIPPIDPTEGGMTPAVFNCSIYDPEGSGNLTVNGTIYNGIDVNKSADCVVTDEENNITNYTCPFNMMYSESPGIWNYECDATGSDNITDTMSSNFTYNELTAWAMDKQSIDFGTAQMGGTNVSAVNNPLTIINTGNTNLTGLIKIKALDLVGTVIPEKVIPADDFIVNVVNSPDGDSMINDTYVTISNTSLDRVQSQGLYFYIKEVPNDLPYQTYDTSTLGGWIITTSGTP